MKLMILDGNSIVNRAFYGIRALSAPDGTPTNAVYGFMTILQRIYEDERPEAVCVSFDLKAPTFRHKAFESYKAQRKGMPEELAVQMPILKEMLDKMGIRRYELEGYEADDILGTVGRICENRGWECVIVTGDKDSLQLVSKTTTVCNVKTRGGSTETIMYTPERFHEEYGFRPELMVDLKALMGDTSDNIPGVPGVGEKTAMGLVQKFGSLDNIYSSIESPDIKAGVRKKLIEGEQSARDSYWLATIVRDAPLSFEPEENIWNKNFTPELYGFLKKLGFNKFINKWGVVESGEERKERLELPHMERKVINGEEELKILEHMLTESEYVSVSPMDGIDKIEVCDGKKVYSVAWEGIGESYNKFLKLLFSDKVKKISHGVKDVMGQLLKEGLSLEGFIFDTELAAYLLDATGSDYTPERLSQGLFETEYHGAEAIYLLYKPMDEKLKELGMESLYYDIELPLCAVLANMEKDGVYVDRNALYEFGEGLNADIKESQAEVFRLAGHEFNINSPKQLGTVLFDQLKLPYGKRTKTGWKTGADILEKLKDKHPIINYVLEYRELTKLKSTYADGLLKVISPDGRIHTSFQMTVTATGRLSSTEPNLQNIPIRKARGAQIRNMFVASPGKVLVDGDYSQIELRLLAHISEDETMREAFLSGEDFHTVTASKVFGVPISEVTPLLRSRAKAVNFGIVYGISAYSLSQDIDVWPNEAQAYMDAYLERYHGVRDYMKNIVEKAKHDGYVSTIFGRRRELPELKSNNYNVRSFGERVALNAPIQGTAADIIKLAMVNVFNRLKKEKLDARLILQIHDELIVECSGDEAEKVSSILKEEMESAVELAVPLVTDVNIGRSWAEAH